MKNKYKIVEIRLTPVTPFFFGKENMSEMGNKNDYFQISSEYPQQTGLLGFLRHKILRDNNINLDANSFNDFNNDAQALIGKRGFEENNSGLSFYGKINSISPCFIINESSEYLWDRSCEYVDNSGVPEEIILNDKKDGFIWWDSKKNIQTKYLSKHFLYKQFNNILKKELIHSDNYIGSYKGGVKPTVKEDSYFIMAYNNLLKKSLVFEIERLKFNKIAPLSFGFFACVENDCRISELPDFMPMGKEKSYFKVETTVFKSEFELNQIFPDFSAFMQLTGDSTPNHVLKCVLLSDARLNDCDLQNLENICLMQIVNQNRFRYIKSATGKFFSGAKPVKVNMAFNLLSKGSVMFIKKEDKTKIENLFNKYLDFKQIGYNYIHFSNAKTI